MYALHYVLVPNTTSVTAIPASFQLFSNLVIIQIVHVIFVTNYLVCALFVCMILYEINLQMLDMGNLNFKIHYTI